MQNLTFRKLELIEKIKKNRETHRSEFEDAAQGYRSESIKLLDSHIDNLKKGKVEQVFINLPIPEDHTKDYDRVIEMLEMCLELEVTITEKQFSQFVLDEWSWTDQFKGTISNYK